MTKKQCKECETQKEEQEKLKESLARTQADYANFRRRTEEQQEQQRIQAARNIITDIVSVLDNLALALQQSKEKTEFHKGVELIYGQLVSTLEEHGATRIQTETFDPQQHEALLSEHANQPKGTIINVLQPGWQLGGHVLRTAKVQVSLGPKEE